MNANFPAEQLPANNLYSFQYYSNDGKEMSINYFSDNELFAEQISGNKLYSSQHYSNDGQEISINYSTIKN